MAGPYDQFPSRNSPGPPRRRRAGPTLEDFEALAAAYQELQDNYKETAQKLEDIEKQLHIKDEAMQMQTADLQRLEAEQVWTNAALEQAQKELKSQKAKKDEDQPWQERYVRLQAEVENMRRRWEQRYSDEVNSERNRVLADMIPLADHLELALQYAQNQSEDVQIAESSFFSRFVSNIEATKQAFLTALKRYNVEPIEPIGERFDPTLHEAVGQLPSEEIPADHIAQVVQTGYVNGERLLRPARVLVSGGK